MDSVFEAFYCILICAVDNLFVISEQPVEDITPDCTGPEVCNMPIPCSNGISYDFSKIRAVIEVLQSLGKPEGSTSGNSCNENLFEGNSTKNGSITGKSLSYSVKFTQEKAIVFSKWTRMLDIFELGLKRSSIQYRRLDGIMSVTARDKAVKDFNTLPEVSVIIMSLKAASLGLNMVAACHVILLDLWWNPTTEDQAVDRAHRIGQTRPVIILRLTVKDIVEGRILALQMLTQFDIYNPLQLRGSHLNFDMKQKETESVGRGAQEVF